MIDLHPITLSDKKWIDPLVWAENSPSADYNFGNLFLWDHAYKQDVGQIGGRLIVKQNLTEHPVFAWPVGTGDVLPVLEEMHTYAKAKGYPLVVLGVTPGHLSQVDALWHGTYTVESGRPYWDYLYTVEKLSTLAGKKLHGKRNHINRFEAENNWRYAQMTPADFPECRALLDDWMASCGEDEQDGIDDEYLALQNAFRYFGELALEGGVLRVDEHLVGFTIGEPICSSTFDVHFEKAHSTLNGAYTMINREFVRQIHRLHPEIQWINREDDTGREGLRQSKLSYYPDAMVEKYAVVLHD